MTISIRSEREAARLKHLVLGAPRPRLPRNKRKKGVPPPSLPSGIEEAVALREKWAPWEGTAETLARADAESRREGSLARLLTSEALEPPHIFAAEEIRAAHASVVGDVAVRTAKLEPQGSANKAADAGEAPAAMLRDLDYHRWRTRLGSDGAMVLAIVVDDMGVEAAARRWRRNRRTVVRILRAALDSWRR